MIVAYCPLCGKFWDYDTGRQLRTGGISTSGGYGVSVCYECNSPHDLIGDQEAYRQKALDDHNLRQQRQQRTISQLNLARSGNQQSVGSRPVAGNHFVNRKRAGRNGQRRNK